MKKFSLYSTTFLCMAFSIFFNSCTKEVSVEGALVGGVSGGTAVYTIAGSDGNCSIPVINGNYTKGLVLEANNTILLQVDVITTGTYVFTTNIANGIQFSTGGNFSVKGIQTIKLVGNGIPTAPGIFQFNLPLGGCAFSIPFS